MRTETLRLFFALWPDAAVQACLAEWGKMLSLSLGGRLTRAETIHLTLAFIGDTPQSRLDEVGLIGDELKAPRFEMQFDTIGCFSRNGIAWAAPDSTPDALLQLVSNLRDRLRKAGFPIESRPYTPHVTLSFSYSPYSHRAARMLPRLNPLHLFQNASFRWCPARPTCSLHSDWQTA